MSDLPTKAEWDAHQAFYKLTVAQRDDAWRESEVLRDAIKGFLAAWASGRNVDVHKAVRVLKGTLARVEEFVP